MATPSYIVSPPEVVPERVNHVAPVGILPVSIFEAAALRAALPGLAVAVLTVLFGFVMGGVFGLNEDLIKDRLAGSAAAVTSTVYGGDPAAAEPIVAKSWEYMQRAHLHGGAIGTAAIGMILVMLLVRPAPRTIGRSACAWVRERSATRSSGWRRAFSRRGSAVPVRRKNHSAGWRCRRPGPCCSGPPPWRTCVSGDGPGAASGDTSFDENLLNG